MATSTTPEAEEITRDITLDIAGMTCASCAMRIEKKLNRMPGVAATVNYATETAKVSAPISTSDAELIKTVHDTGYEASLPQLIDESLTETVQDRELRSLRQRLIGAIILTIPVVAMAMIPALQFNYWGFASLVLAAPVVVWAGWPFHRATFLNLRHGTATMDTLITMGTSAALLWSIYALFWGTAGEKGMVHHFSFIIEASDGASNIYLEVAAAVITFVLMGRYFEKRAKKRAGAALEALLEMGAKSATVRRGEKWVEIAASELTPGDVVLIRPGEKVPSDAIVNSGHSAVDESMITGESVPVEVGPGAELVGATINQNGSLEATITRVGSETQLAQMAKLVTDAQSGKASVQRLADKISAVFVPIVILIAIATLGVWLGAGFGAPAAFTAAVAVLIIACPCALGLATPTALLVGTGRGAQMGVLIRGPEVLERSRKLDVIVLDKTGTITAGKMKLAEVLSTSSVPPDALLQTVASLEDHSEHPVAKAIVNEARERGLALSQLSEFASTPGLGVSGLVDGQKVVAGQIDQLRASGAEISEEFLAQFELSQATGATTIAVAIDNVAAGMIVIADEIRPSSAVAIKKLHEMGLETVLLSGDSEAVSRSVALEVGIDRVIAQVRPEDKLAEIKRLQDQGLMVAMVGDGVNDAAALVQADLGMAMASGADVAIEAADITLVRNDLMAAVDAIRLSRKTLGTIRMNLFWAFAYNTAAIPLAAFGLLNPMLAGAAMAFSSVFVVGNSLLLRRFKATKLR